MYDNPPEAAHATRTMSGTMSGKLTTPTSGEITELVQAIDGEIYALADNITSLGNRLENVTLRTDKAQADTPPPETNTGLGTQLGDILHRLRMQSQRVRNLHDEVSL